MRKILGFVLSAAMLMPAVPQVYAAADDETSVYRDIYVSADGSDDGDGSENHPFRTLERARLEVRAINDAMTGDIVVHIGSGKYYIDKTMIFEVEDSGKNGYNVIWQGEDKDNTVISGGREISGFKKSDKYEGVWEADAADFEYLLQLSVNGSRRYFARSAAPITAQKKNAVLDTKEYYAANPGDPGTDYQYTWYNPETPYKYDGIFLSKRDAGIYENADDMLMWQNACFVDNYFEVEDIMQSPYDSDQVIMTFENPFFANRAYASYSQPFAPTRDFYIGNAIELLDEPGEFYFNKKTKKLYYMPCEGEDMNTAEVVAPYLEGLMIFYGNDIDDKVKNITFENVKFSDTAWDIRSCNLGQAVWNNGERIGERGFKAVNASYADNVNFYDNVFCNIAGTALEYSNACENSSAIGNTLYDIGENGIVVGMMNHGDYNFDDVSSGAAGVSWAVPEEHKDDPVDLIVAENTRIDSANHMSSGKAISTVAYPGFSNPDRRWNDAYVTMNKTWFDEDSTTMPYENQPAFSGSWKDEVSSAKGEKSWIKFEFMKPYKLEDIVLAFETETVSDEEKSDFEILASNDLYFRDYDVIAVQEGAAPNEVNTYSVQSDKAYQYVMIRTTRVKPFALSRAWITTRDIKPYVKLQRCRGINIENNALDRIGIDFPRSIGITILHGNDCKIMHNDLQDVGYTGISVGFRWDVLNITCRNIEVGYNRIFDVVQAEHDGGGIYTLGPQPDSVYHHNYVNTTNQSIFALYLDNGSRYMTWRDNIVIGGTYAMSIRMTGVQGMQDNTLVNNYANHSISNSAAASANNYEPQTVIPTGSVVDATSYDTFYNSGLEEQYRQNLELIPQNHDNLEYKYNLNYAANKKERAEFYPNTVTGVTEWISYTLKNTDFGDGLGQMPLMYQHKLKQMQSYFEGSENSDDIMRLTKARELERELSTAVRRYSLSDTVKLCDEKLEFVNENLVAADGKGSCGRYPTDAAAAFEKELNDVKSQITDNIDTDTEYKLLLRLEKAYNTVEGSRNSSEITNVYADNLIDVKIDSAAREVKLYVPKSADTKLTGFSLELSPNAELAKVIGSEPDLAKPITVPIRCKGNGRYTIWTISLAHKEGNSDGNINAANWITTTDETDMIKKYADGSVCLPAGEYIYMADSCSSDNENTVMFAPMSQNKLNTFKVIIGAEKAENQENSTTVNNRCELVFDNDSVKFYKRVNGSSSLIESAENVSVNYNSENTLKYTIEEIDNNLYFKIWLNGKLILSPVVEKYPYDNYTGFYSKYMNIKV